MGASICTVIMQEAHAYSTIALERDIAVNGYDLSASDLLDCTFACVFSWGPSYIYYSIYLVVACGDSITTSAPWTSLVSGILSVSTYFTSTNPYVRRIRIGNGITTSDGVYSGYYFYGYIGSIMVTRCVFGQSSNHIYHAKWRPAYIYTTSGYVYYRSMAEFYGQFSIAPLKVSSSYYVSSLMTTNGNSSGIKLEYYNASSTVSGTIYDSHKVSLYIGTSLNPTTRMGYFNNATETGNYAFYLPGAQYLTLRMEYRSLSTYLTTTFSGSLMLRISEFDMEDRSVPKLAGTVQNELNPSGDLKSFVGSGINGIKYYPGTATDGVLDSEEVKYVTYTDNSHDGTLKYAAKTKSFYATANTSAADAYCTVVRIAYNSYGGDYIDDDKSNIRLYTGGATNSTATKFNFAYARLNEIYYYGSWWTTTASQYKLIGFNPTITSTSSYTGISASSSSVVPCTASVGVLG